jgi:hypothetical protein
LTPPASARSDTPVRLLFLDESGQLSERKFFALGGVVIRDTDWHELRDLWQETLAGHAWPADREVKWHGIRTGEVPRPLADAIVAALGRAPLRCYVSLLDIELGSSAAPEFFATDEDVYATGLMLRSFSLAATRRASEPLLARPSLPLRVVLATFAPQSGSV